MRSTDAKPCGLGHSTGRTASPEQTPSLPPAGRPGTPSGRSRVQTQLPTGPTSFMRGAVHRARSPRSSEQEPADREPAWHPPRLSLPLARLPSLLPHKGWGEQEGKGTSLDNSAMMSPAASGLSKPLCKMPEEGQHPMNLGPTKCCW